MRDYDSINHFICVCKQRNDPPYFYKRIWWRIKTCFKLLFLGYAEFKGCWLVDKPDELKELIDYLNNCYCQMIIKKQEKSD